MTAGVRVKDVPHQGDWRGKRGPGDVGMKRVSNRAWRGGKMRVCADCHSATALLEHFGKVNI